MACEHVASVRRPAWRRAALALILAAGAASSASAQGNAKPTAVTEESVQTPDGWTIPFTYYQSNLGPDAPVVILLAMETGDRLAWVNNGIPQRLQEQGIAVIAADLRKQGEAKPAGTQGAGELRATDYKAMAAIDLEALKKFIYQEHQDKRLNMAMTGIVAPSELAPVAMTWAELDWAKRPYNDAPTVAASTPRGQDVKAIVLLSPKDRVGGLSSAKSAALMRALPVSLLVVSSNNASDRKDAAKILEQFETAPDKDSRIFKSEYGVKLRGTELLGNPSFASEFPPGDLIVGFFDKQLKSLGLEWRDRRSRLQR